VQPLIRNMGAILVAGATPAVEGCAALELEATTESIAKTIHAHPTLSEALMEAAEDVLGHSIHQ